MASPPIQIDIAVTSTTGAQVTPPQAIRDTLVNYISLNNPGYTILPGGLIEDLSSTCTYAIALIDALVVDFMNCFTPTTANPWLLTQMGNLVGVSQGLDTNTSVYVVFTGNPGWIVVPGFTVSDGNHQYIVQDGGIVASGGSTDPLYCIAAQPGIWAVPQNTVTTIATSLPPSISLTVTNPQSGTPGAPAQTEEDYREQVLQAWAAPATAFQTMLKTLLAAVPGVQPRLIGVAQVQGGGWEVIVGGGDPYQIAFAIFQSGIDISTLQGSTNNIVSASKANPCVIVGELYLPAGATSVTISGATGMTGINGTWTPTIINPTTFSIPYNSIGAPNYTGAGLITPNTRTITTNINSYPDTYTIPFVNPPQMTVLVQLTWNSVSPNVVSPTSVAQVAAPAIANYINSIPVGAPINEFELNSVFKIAVENLVDHVYVTRMIWTITINGTVVLPNPGTGAVYGDPESYFYTTAANVTITQG